MKIYLAGKIPKGKEQATFDNWQKRYREVLSSFLDADYVDHSQIKADERDLQGIFGLDCTLLRDSDIVIVNAERKLGVGTSQEMVVAKYFKKPVIVVLPKDTHHRKKEIDFHGETITDWIHPFIDAFADAIVEKPEEIESIVSDLGSMDIKDLSVIEESMHYYESL